MLKAPPTASLTPAIIELCHALGARFNIFEDHDWEIASEIYHGHADALRQMQDQQRLAILQEIRLSSGWWGDNPKVAFADKAGNVMDHRRLRRILVSKTKAFFAIEDNVHDIQEKLMAPGIVFLQHRSVPCYRFCSKTHSVFEEMQSLVLGALGGSMEFRPILTLLLCTKQSEWNFYFKHCPLERADVLFNESLFETDSLWPKGTNDKMVMTLQTLPEIRASMQKHSWPNLFHPVQRFNKTNAIDCLLPPPKSFQDMTYTEFHRCAILCDPRDMPNYDDNVKTFHSLILKLKTHSDGKFHDDDVDHAMQICAYMRALIKSKDGDEWKSFNRALHLQSGWWGLGSDPVIQDNVFNLEYFIDLLAEKTQSWYAGQGSEIDVSSLRKSLGEPGVFVFQHRTIPYFRFVRGTEHVINEVRGLIHETLKAVDTSDPVLSAMLLSTSADEWIFYIMINPEKGGGDIEINELDILENTSVIMTDSLWPKGANRSLTLNHTTLSHFRDSCMDSQWPQAKSN